MIFYPGMRTTLIAAAGEEAGAPGDTRRERRGQLGAFIRLHRQQLAPESLGLASTPRRRTPGLRREDLAQLCRVSSTWITWLEQGRDVAASAGVLARLADALRLKPAERSYLFELAERRDPAQQQPEPALHTDEVMRSVQAMACPAYVLDRGWNVIACNAQAAELFLDWRVGGGEGDEHAPNLLRFLFLAPSARQLIHDWHGRAMRLVAEFRADAGRLADAPPLRELVDELSGASPEFAAWWQSQQVMEREGGARRFQHPRLGERIYEQLTLHPALRPDLKLVMLLLPALRSPSVSG